VGDFPHLVGARASHEHLGESFGNVRFIAAVAFKRLGVEWAFPISGNFDVLEPTRRGDQIAGIGAVAMPFALGATFCPSYSNELIEFFTHHFLYHHPHCSPSQSTQMLMKLLLLGHNWGG
jgi:hypothetical protein